MIAAIIALTLASDVQATTERVRVTADWSAAEPLVDELARRLEVAIGLFERETGYVLPADERLVFHLFGNQEDMTAAVEGAGCSPTSANALTVIETHESYVAMQPTPHAPYLEAVGGVPEVLEAQVLHEAVHQFVARSHHVPEAFLPGWFIEGRAEYLARLAFLAGRRGPHDHLWIDSSRNKVALACEARETLSLDDLLRATYRGLPEAIYYDQSASLYEFLSTDRNGFGHALARFTSWIDGQSVSLAERARANADFRPRVHLADRYLRGHLGDLGALRRAWKKSAVSKRGDWYELWRGSQWVDDELITASNAGASHSLVLKNEPPREREFHISGEVLPMRGAGCIFLGVDPSPLAFARVELARDYVAVATYVEGRWRDHGATRFARRPDGSWLDLELSVIAHELTVELDGCVLEAELAPGLNVEGDAWGVGAANGVARFRSLLLR